MFIFYLSKSNIIISILHYLQNCYTKTYKVREHSVGRSFILLCALLTPQLSSQKLHVTVFFQERPIDLEIPFSATAKDIAYRIIIINRLQRSQEWTIFEFLKDYDLGKRNMLSFNFSFMPFKE